jgi:hypothetical protein
MRRTFHFVIIGGLIILGVLSLSLPVNATPDLLCEETTSTCPTVTVTSTVTITLPVTSTATVTNTLTQTTTRVTTATSTKTSTVTQTMTSTITTTRTITATTIEQVEVPLFNTITMTIIQESERAVPTTVWNTETVTMPVTTTTLKTVTRTETQDAEVFWQTTSVTTTGTIVITQTLSGPVTGGMGCELQTAMMYQPASSSSVVWLILGLVMIALALLLGVSKLVRKLKL